MQVMLSHHLVVFYMSAEKRSELFIFPLKGEKCLSGVFLLARLWLSPGWGRGEWAWKG